MTSTLLPLVSRNTPPVVEIDTAKRTAYVRFGNRRVTRTDPLPRTRGRNATIEFDAENLVIGLRFFEVQEFTISKLLRGIDLGISDSLLRRTRYILSK